MDEPTGVPGGLLVPLTGDNFPALILSRRLPAYKAEIDIGREIINIPIQI